METSKNYKKYQWDGAEYHEGTPSDIRKVITLLKKKGARQKNGRHPMREGQLYQLEILGPKEYNIWSPGIQIKEKPAKRSSVWDLKNLDTLRTSRPAVFRSLYYEAANSIQGYHLCNAVHDVRYDEPYHVAQEAWECLHADVDREMDVDVINDLRYAIAIMAVCIAGVAEEDDKRTYRYARKVVKYNRKVFLKVFLKDQTYDYVYGMLDDDFVTSM